MKKIFSLVLALGAITTLAQAAVQQEQATVNCGTTKTITATAKTGYHFEKWNDNNTDNPRTVTVSADITYTATFAPNTDTEYKVEHYKQNLDNTYPASAYETDDLNGTTGASITPAVKSYEGFTAPSTTTTTIAADGSTVVVYQYTRNSYTLTWVTDGDALSGAYTSGSVKYGATITEPNTPTKTGYTFNGWSANVASTMPAANTTYTATWIAADVNYTVKHHQQNIANDEYTEVTGDEQVLSGKTGAQTAAVAKTTGEYAYFDAKAFSQSTIAADGSTVINIYYDRKTYTATFKNGETTLETVNNVRYGATPVYGGATPTKDPDASYTYTFSGWNPALGAISGNTTYTAQFNAIPKTFYTITTAVDPDAGVGTVTGGGSYESGSEVTLTATSDDACYVFDHWKEDNNTNASRTITISGNATYTAVFKQLQYTITIQSEDDTMGTVSAE